MLQYFEVCGTDYEKGFEIGKRFKEYLNKVIGKYDEQKQKAFDKIKSLELKLKEILPDCLDEIYGRADGAGVSRDSMLLLFFPEIFKKIDNCTTVIVKKPDRVLFAHNEDEPFSDTSNTALIKYNYEDRFVVSYTRADRLAGSAFSFNSYGLFISTNFIFGENLNLDNLSRYIVSRELINSKSIDEVLDKLNRYEVASAFSINVLDLNSLEVINVEKDVKEYYKTQITERYARSNHFHTKVGDTATYPESTRFRFVKTNELVKKVDVGSATLKDVLDILGYEGDTYDTSVHLNYDKYPTESTTIATFCTDTTKNEIYVFDYMGKTILTLDRQGNLLSRDMMK